MTSLSTEAPDGVSILNGELRLLEVARYVVADGDAECDSARSVHKGLGGTYKPESKPLASGVHGSAKELWVTVWFFCCGYG